jgi:hypothetical protein
MAWILGLLDTFYLRTMLNSYWISVATTPCTCKWLKLSWLGFWLFDWHFQASPFLPLTGGCLRTESVGCSRPGRYGGRIGATVAAHCGPQVWKVYGQCYFGSWRSGCYHPNFRGKIDNNQIFLCHSFGLPLVAALNTPNCSGKLQSSCGYWRELELIHWCPKDSFQPQKSLQLLWHPCWPCALRQPEEILPCQTASGDFMTLPEVTLEDPTHSCSDHTTAGSLPVSWQPVHLCD